MTLRVWFTLSHDGDVHWATCTLCSLEFIYDVGLNGKRKLLKWMGYHRVHHQMTHIAEDFSDQ